MRLDPALVGQIPTLRAGLAAFLGHRSVWLDPLGRLWHAEPEDEELDALGHRYVGTFLRPTAEDLAHALTGIAVPTIRCLHVATAPISAPAQA